MPLMSLLLLLGVLAFGVPEQQSGAAPNPEVETTIQNLGSFDFDTRTNAARTVRRWPAAIAVPALEAAARAHADDYVRFRAFVLLSGMDAGATSRVAEAVIADPNDRVRTVAYQWFERRPNAAVLPRLIAALPSEMSEFVRPALTRAIAAHASDPSAQEVLRPLVFRGEDMFRGTVITALGEYGGTYALKELISVAQLEGPLQDDAVTALGRIGDPQVRGVLAELQRTGPRELQPTVSAAICLLKTDCPARLTYVTETLRFAAAANQLPLLRGAVHALGVLALAGHQTAVDSLLDAALASSGVAQDAIVLGLGTVILRQPSLALSAFEARQQAPAVAELFRDAFDMLSEDFVEEQFGAEMRRALWEAPEDSPRRRAAQVLLDVLEF
jgi:HEAT repeat protein